MIKSNCHIIAGLLFFSVVSIFPFAGKSQGNSGSVRISAGKNAAPEFVSDSVKTALGLDLPAQPRIKMNHGKNENPVHDSLPPDPAENIPVNRVINKNKQD